MSKEIADAVETLKTAFKEDQEFANGWHDNIAMAMFDGIGEDNAFNVGEMSAMCNKGASNFMKLAFNVTTTIPSERK